MDADVVFFVFPVVVYFALATRHSLCRPLQCAGHTAKLFDQGVARQRRCISSSETCLSASRQDRGK